MLKKKKKKQFALYHYGDYSSIYVAYFEQKKKGYEYSIVGISFS